MLLFQNKRKKMAGNNPMIERLPKMCKALDSIFSMANKRK